MSHASKYPTMPGVVSEPQGRAANIPFFKLACLYAVKGTVENAYDMGRCSHGTNGELKEWVEGIFIPEASLRRLLLKMS